MQLNELLLKTIPGGKWELRNKGGVIFRIPELNLSWKVPYGFKTDLNSGHFLPESWHHRSRHAALLHDHLYHKQQTTRKDADRAFYYVLQERGAKPWRAWLMYQAVRAGGWMAWRKNKNAS